MQGRERYGRERTPEKELLLAKLTMLSMRLPARDPEELRDEPHWPKDGGGVSASVVDGVEEREPVERRRSSTRKRGRGRWRGRSGDEASGDGEEEDMAGRACTTAKKDGEQTGTARDAGNAQGSGHGTQDEGTRRRREVMYQEPRGVGRLPPRMGARLWPRSVYGSPA